MQLPMSYTKKITFDVWDYELLPYAASIFGWSMEHTAMFIHKFCCDVEALSYGADLERILNKNIFAETKYAVDKYPHVGYIIDCFGCYLENAIIEHEDFKQGDFFIMCRRNDQAITELLPIKQIKWYPVLKDHYTDEEIYEMVIRNRKNWIDADQARLNVTLNTVLDKKKVDPMLFQMINTKINHALTRGEL